jgi:hypothetical protein
LAGVGPILRFLYFVAIGEGSGHIQSLVLGGVMMLLGALSIMLGIVADLIGRNRQLLETMLERVRKMEERLPIPSDKGEETESRAVLEIGNVRRRA